MSHLDEGFGVVVDDQIGLDAVLQEDLEAGQQKVEAAGRLQRLLHHLIPISVETPLGNGHEGLIAISPRKQPFDGQPK